MVTVSIKGVLIGVLLIALIVLVVFLIVLVANVTDTIKKTNAIIDGGTNAAAGAAEKVHNASEKVKEGASLLVTWSCGSLQPFEKVFGVRPEWRRQGAGARKVAFDGATIEFSQQYQLALSAHGADVIATDQDGMPVLTLCKYGKGNVAFLALGIEAELAGRPDAFDVNSQPVWKFYRWFADVAGIRRIARSNDPFVTCTEHVIDASHAIVVAVNNTPEERKCDFAIENAWTISKTLFGTRGVIAPNTATMMELELL